MERGRKTADTATTKRKKVTVTPIERDPDGGPEAYAILDRLIASVRSDLVELKISLAWKRGWLVDKDKLLKAGKCCKPNEVSRQLMEFDVVILLNEELWPNLEPRQREELVFHELMHVVVVLDNNGDPKLDEKGRIVWRFRKHDIEEFKAVRVRYGQDNLRAIGADVLAKSKEPLLQARGGKKPQPVGSAA